MVMVNGVFKVTWGFQLSYLQSKLLTGDYSALMEYVFALPFSITPVILLFVYLPMYVCPCIYTCIYQPMLVSHVVCS